MAVNDQRFRVFDLLHDQTDIHGRELRLALAAAIDAMLADQGQRVRENIERRGESAAHRAHLEFVSLFGFTIIVEQVIPSLPRIQPTDRIVKPLGHVDQRLQAESDRTGFVVLPFLLANERPGDVEMSPGRPSGTNS